MSEYITKKKKKIDLGEIVSKALNKEGKPQYITKKQKFITKKSSEEDTPQYITKKSPEEIKERAMRGNNMSGGRVGLKSGSKGCKLAMKGKGRAYGKNS